MKTKTILSYFWKLPLCGIVFFVGMAIGGGLLPLLGLQAPAPPVGTDANTIALWFLLGSLIAAFGLSFIAQGLALNAWKRWLVLAALTWVLGAVGMVIESFFFMNTDAVSSLESALFTALNFLLPSVFLAGSVVTLFRPRHKNEPIALDFSLHSWIWQLLTAWLAYPLLYIAFGLLVKQFVIDFYAQNALELVLPTWGQLVPLQLARSALFLLVCLPVVIAWRNSRQSLWLALGLAFFVLTAFMAVITAYWFPWQLRLFHGLELLADGLTYALVLAWVFDQRNKTLLGVSLCRN